MSNSSLSPKQKELLSEIVRRGLHKVDVRPKWTDIARPEQVRPLDCVEWLFLAGRGAGKTRSASERLKQRIEAGDAKYIALIGRTFADVRDIMVEGESGLLSVIGKDQVQTYNRSIGEIVFKGGCRARFFSGEKPESLRGWQSTDIWGDELAAWEYAQATYDMAMFGFRLGKPEAIWTTTPKPIGIVKKLIERASTETEGVKITRGSTYANRANLADAFFTSIVRKYEGTRLGLQELEGQVLEDVQGALWKREDIDIPRMEFTGEIPSQIVKIVVAVDPSVTDPEKRKNPNKEPDACGIVVAGIDADGIGYVLNDLSAILSPSQWAKVTAKAYDYYKAASVVAEVNQGGQLVEDAIKAVAGGIAVIKVHAAVGKRARAEQVALLYEQHRIKHVGRFDGLEAEMCGWDSTDPSSPSPNRVDALVWAFHGLGLCNVNEIRTTSRIKQNK